jgi:hypothetical protein
VRPALDLQRVRTLARLVGAFAAGVVALGLAAPANAAPTYRIDLLPMRSTVQAMNTQGDVAGAIQVPPNYQSRNFARTADGSFAFLPDAPGLPTPIVSAMNAAGLVVGFAGYEGAGERAIVWTPTEDGYSVQALDPLPGHTNSAAAGVDDQGRVVGESYLNFFGGPRVPFVWTEADGMIDLSTFGAPNSPAVDVSPGGMVLHVGGWYSLDSPADGNVWVPPPPGFFPPAGYLGAINDAGVQAIWLRLTSGQEHSYARLTRYDAGYNFLSQPVSLQSGQNWIGGINQSNDIVAQITNRGMLYFGDGTSSALDSLLAPSYPGVEIYRANDIDDARKVAGRAVIGNGTYAVRLLPTEPCSGPSCIRSQSIALTAELITPDPGRCVPGAYVRATAKVKIVDARGRQVRASVTTRMFNTIFDDLLQTAKTNKRGVARFEFTGECGGGSVSVLVTGATLTGRQFDHTAGVVVASVVPK